MAIYEPEHDRIVLRVVYDGPGHVGKTTNVEQLALAFVGEHRPDPQDSPLATGGRTRYFDWFSFDGGKLDGHALQIQIVGVPGPKRFEARRAHLLRSADVVVLVCDSTLAAQELARETLVSQREHLGALADDIPLVVQANKQDIHQALLPHEVGMQLVLPFEVPVLGAQASAGIGVRETMVQAVRAAVRRIKRHITRNGIQSLAGKPGDADSLRADLDRLASSAVPEDGPAPPPKTRKRGASRRTVVREPKAVNIRAGLIAHNHGELSEIASRDDDPEARPPIASDPEPNEPPPAADPKDMSQETGRRPARRKPRQTVTLSPIPDDPPLPDLSPRQTFTLSPEPDDPPLPDLSPRPPLVERLPAPRPARRDTIDDLFSGTDAPQVAGTAAPQVPRDLPSGTTLEIPRHLSSGTAAPPPPPNLSSGTAAPQVPTNLSSGAASLLSPNLSSGPASSLSHNLSSGTASPLSPNLSSGAASSLSPNLSSGAASSLSPNLSSGAASPLSPNLPPGPASPLAPSPSSGTAAPVPGNLSPGTASPLAPNMSSGTATPSAPDAADRARFAQGDPTAASLHALVELATTRPSPRHGHEHAHGHEHELAPRPVEEPTADETLPPLPRADVPPGHVWPIPRGREILRGLADQPLDRLPAPPRTARDPPLLLAVGAWRLCTRPSQRFATLEAAHAALVERVRQTRPCAALLASEIVLVVQPEPDGGGRLWHVAPRLDGIREHLALRPPQARPRVLAALAATIVGVLRLWLRHQVALELNLSAFAVEAGRVVHLGDPIAGEQSQLGTALLGFCERLSGDAAALAAFTAALEQELSQLEPDERTRLDLETALTRAETRYQDAHIARSRLLAALRDPV